jgi:hypothetical protein
LRLDSGQAHRIARESYAAWTKALIEFGMALQYAAL